MKKQNILCRSFLKLGIALFTKQTVKMVSDELTSVNETKSTEREGISKGAAVSYEITSDGILIHLPKNDKYNWIPAIRVTGKVEYGSID